MRTTIAAGAVGALLAGGMTVHPAAQNLERTMEGFLDVRYGVVCVCLCDELELEMHDSAGLVLGVERTVVGPEMALWLTPAATGRVAFDATLECPAGTQCAWGMQLFRVN